MSHHRAQNRRGFTAIELSAVVTIIAILSLILITVMRKRVEEAKITAAQADMRQISVSEQLIQADTGHHVRLWDMARPQPDSTDSAATVQAKLPKASWDTPNDTGLYNAWKNGWKGPYAAPQRSNTVYEIVLGYPQMFRGDSVAGLTPQTGPILILTADNTDEQGQGALTRMRYPIDPWGNPYIFFGSGAITTGSYPLAITNETNFSTAVIYCTGPSGTPGSVLNPTSVQYYRETGILGTGDDLMFQF